MSESPVEVRRPPFRFDSLATFALLAVNIAVFIYEFYLIRGSDRLIFEYKYALSLDGLREHHYWQILSYQFLHGGFLHIFLNSWAIFIFGRAIEFAVGWWRMLVLYFLSGIMGGLLQMAFFWIWPHQFGDASVVGASAGAFGLVAAFSILFPNQRLLMLLFFVIPVAMRARTLLWVSIALAVLGMVLPFWKSLNQHGFQFLSFFNNIGHAAHLGGLLTGCVIALLLRQHFRSQPQY